MIQDPFQRHIMTVYQSGGVPRSFLAFTVSLVCFSLPLFSETRPILRLQTSCKSSRDTVAHFSVIWAEATLPGPCPCYVPCRFPLLNGRGKVWLSCRFFVGAPLQLVVARLCLPDFPVERQISKLFLGDQISFLDLSVLRIPSLRSMAVLVGRAK